MDSEALIAIVGIVGTLLGALLGGLAGYWTAARREKFERSIIFHNQRLDTYADIAESAGMLSAYSTQIAEPDCPDGLLDVFAEENRKFVRAYNRGLLLASKKVRKALEELKKQTVLHVRWANTRSAGSADEADRPESISQLLERFREMASEEMAVPPD